MISHEVFEAAGVDGERYEAGRGVCAGKKLKETQAREAEMGRVRDGTVIEDLKRDRGGDAYSEMERHVRKLRKM